MIRSEMHEIYTFLSSVSRWTVSIIAWLLLVLLLVIMVLLGAWDQVFKNRYCCQSKCNLCHNVP